MKQIFSLLLILFTTVSGFATHNRAGEITYTHISGLTYEVKITTYTRESVVADRCELELFWGDTTSSILPRSNGPSQTCPAPAHDGEFIGNDIRKNEYIGRHTYPAPGIYYIYFEDPNRNAGINNIIQSVSVPFYVQSELVIAPGLGSNSSPVLLNPPIDEGCLNQKFEHDPGAFDSNGDLLTFHLVNSRGAGGSVINTIYDPQFVQDSVKIDSLSGLMTWDSPRNVGQFNFAIEIREWRRNSDGEYVQIGYITRDLQVNINACEERNRPPQIPPLGPFCVEAGQTLRFTVTATDPDNDKMTLRAFGGPYQLQNPPEPFGATATGGSVSDEFVWNTACNHVRNQPYYVTFEAKDDPSQRSSRLTSLVDLQPVEIKVVAPAPKNPQATYNNADAIQLSWDESICKQATGYKVYRREGSYGFVPDQCETGVPAYTGYELLDSIDGLSSTSYLDTFDLKRGVQYCYMVVACLPGESVSYASVEFCASLALDRPMMTNVDVLSTDAANGEIEVKWIAPPLLDSALFPPPYSYKLYRADGIEGTDFTEIASFTSLQDTFYQDQGLNTEEDAYRYKVELYYGAQSDLLGESDPASSVFLNVTPADQQNILTARYNTPWLNDSFVILKDTSGNQDFAIIDTAFSPTYIDTGLENGETYCYQMRTIGAYTASGDLPAPLINNSQRDCATPIDTTKPCAPQFTGGYFCQNDSLYLSWDYPMDSACTSDILQFNIYLKPTPEDEFPDQPWATFSVNDPNELIIFGEPIDVGCYAITAVDDAVNDPNGISNESNFSSLVCVEPCATLEFPNIFTPNGDDVNDRFRPRSKNIQSFQVQIYNRWGALVYESQNPGDFLQNGWDGTDNTTGEVCADGVYYYVFRYLPLSLSVPRTLEITGFVHLVTNN